MAGRHQGADPFVVAGFECSSGIDRADVLADDVSGTATADQVGRIEAVEIAERGVAQGRYAERVRHPGAGLLAIGVGRLDELASGARVDDDHGDVLARRAQGATSASDSRSAMPDPRSIPPRPTGRGCRSADRTPGSRPPGRRGRVRSGPSMGTLLPAPGHTGEHERGRDLERRRRRQARTGRDVGGDGAVPCGDGVRPLRRGSWPCRGGTGPRSRASTIPAGRLRRGSGGGRFGHRRTPRRRRPWTRPCRRRRDGRRHRQCHGQAEPVVVVGVLADEVDPAGCHGDQGRLGSEAGAMRGDGTVDGVGERHRRDVTHAAAGETGCAAATAGPRVGAPGADRPDPVTPSV